MIKLILPQRWETCWPPKVYFYSVKEEILKFDNTLNLDFEFFQNVNLFFQASNHVYDYSTNFTQVKYVIRKKAISNIWFFTVLFSNRVLIEW